MRLLQLGTILLLSLTGIACDGRVERSTQSQPADSATPETRAPHSLEASGTFRQTGITSLSVRHEGENTVLEQTSTGEITGTIDGTYEDDLVVIVHPDGRFNARFTIVATCEVDGREGTLEFRAQDHGSMVSDDTGAFTGNAVITSGSGELIDLRGMLRIDGTVDIPSGLSTYDYSGDLRHAR